MLLCNITQVIEINQQVVKAFENQNPVLKKTDLLRIDLIFKSCRLNTVAVGKK